MSDKAKTPQTLQPTQSFMAEDMVIQELKIPRESEESPEVAAQFFANVTRLLNYSFMQKLLGKKLPTIAVEIAAVDQTIRYYLICPRSMQSYLESQLKAQYPLLIILPTQDYLSQTWRTPGGFDAGQLVLGANPFYPLKTYRDFKDVDPLISVLSILAKAKSNETMVIQYILGPRDSTIRKRGYQYIEQQKKAAAPTASGAAGASIDEMALAQIKTKISEITMKVGIRVFVHAATRDRARELLQELGGSFGGFSHGEGNYLTLWQPSSLRRKNFLLTIPTRHYKYVPPSQIFSVSELASMWHMPNKKFALVPSISWSRAFATETPENIPNSKSENRDDINFFGRADFKGESITFGIKRKDRRRHVYIVGKSGAGKSTLIANMAINDIRNREGMAIIDPHGDLVETILDYIPSYRVNDIIYLDPANSERSFVINPLEVTHAAQRELVVSGLVGIFKKLYIDSWGPRLEYILRNTLFALSEIPDATMIDIPEILANKSYRQRNIENIHDPVIKNFFQNEFEGMTDKLQAEAISPILNKVGQFISSPTMRNIIGKPKSTIDLEGAMNSGKVVLVNLSQGKVGEDNAALLGAMLITKFQLAAMNRVHIAEDQRKDFFLYVDEFQNFATSSFNKILSEARKYRLALTLANQYSAQVPEDVLAAIYGNCGTLISFIVGADDANKLAKEFDEVYKASDLTSLSNYHTIIKLMIDSEASRPFAATTLPLPRSLTQNREKVITISNQKYTKPVVNYLEEAKIADAAAKIESDKRIAQKAALGLSPTMRQDDRPSNGPRQDGPRPPRSDDRSGSRPPFRGDKPKNRQFDRPKHR